MNSIEEEIDSRLPYRIGWPKLPVLPVQTRFRGPELSEHTPDFGHHVQEIDGILAKYHIHQREPPFFAYRANYGVDLTDRSITLVLLSIYEHDCQDRWIKAVKEIRMGFAQAGISYTIELIDERAFYRSLYTSPILSTDRNLIEGWSKVLPDFLTTIENRNWVAIDVLNREFPTREMQPTVIISARDANDDTWWGETLPNLNQLLQANDLKIDITLLFLEGIGFTMTTVENRTEPNPSVRDNFYANPLNIGTSCGVLGSASSGTLGCRIKLQKDSSTLELGLTNYHVMKDAFAAQEPISGPFPPDTGEPYGVAVSPSDRDHEVTVQGMRKHLNRFSCDYELALQRFQFLALDDPAWVSKRDSIQRASGTRAALEQQLRDAETFLRRIGRIYAASGFRVCENPRFSQLMQQIGWALDWCLCRVEKPSSISGQLGYVPRAAEYAGSGAEYVRSGAEVTQYCSISAEKNYNVVKRGRTTDWTKGKTSAVNTICRMQDHSLPPLKLPTNQKVNFEEKWGKPVFVHAILGTKEVPQFLEPGDSGSIVLLDQASNIPGESIIGLGFAANPGSYASYMIPMDLIVGDIERVTGGQVIEPRNAGEVHVDYLTGAVLP